MSNTPIVADAVALAARVHRDQRDKAGQSSILHPLRVMLRQRDETSQIVAVLHDVLEDSEVTVSDLRNDGYSEEVIAALETLTKRGWRVVRRLHRTGGDQSSRSNVVSNSISAVTRRCHPHPRSPGKAQEG